MPCTTINQVVIDHRAPWPTTADRIETMICRPLTEVERAAIDYSDAVIARTEASHEMRKAMLSDKERRYLGIVL